MMVFRFSKRHREFLTSDGTFENKMPPHLETRINTFRSVLAQLHREKQFPAFQVTFIVSMIMLVAFMIFKIFSTF